MYLKACSVLLLLQPLTTAAFSFAWKVALERGIAHAEWSVYRMPPPDQPHGRVSFLEGRPGVLAVLGALHHQSGNAAAALTACEVSTEGSRGLLDSC